MTQIWALRSRLEKQPTDLRQKACYFGDRTLGGLLFLLQLLEFSFEFFNKTFPFLC
jgi:hypothetical protein